MNKIIVISIWLNFLTISVVFSQLWCNFNTGTKYTYGIYLASNSRVASQIYEVRNKTSQCDTTFVEISQKTQGREIIYNVKAYNNGEFINLVQYLELVNFYNAGSVVIEPIWWLGYPKDMKIGDTLQSYFYERKSGKYPIGAKMYDRVVEAIDTIDTKLGKFECFRIVAKNQSKGQHGTMNFIIKEWFNKENGLIKQETYRLSDKLETYILIEKIEKK